MTVAERLAELRDQKLRIIADYEKIERARFSETITDDEYRYLLQQQFGGLTKEQSLARINQRIKAFERHQPLPTGPEPHKSHTMLYLAIAVVLLGILGTYFFIELNGGITGLTTFDAVTEQPILVGGLYDADTDITLNVTDLKGLRANGVLLGEGNATIRAIIDGTSYVVATVDGTDSYDLSTDKSVYTLGETVAISVLPAPEEATYYAYIGEESYPIAGDTFVPPQTGEYRLDALITAGNEVIKESTAFIVTNRTNATNITIAPAIETTFDECVETCNFTEPIQGEITIIIDVQGGELELGELAILTPRENQAPVQITALPDLTLDQPATINLNTYFDDPDGDTITYEINNMIGVDERIDGNILTLNGTIPGNYTTYIYASDTIALTQSETFTVIVPEPITETPPMNGTTNETINETIPINDTLPNNDTVQVNVTTPANATEPIATNVTVNESIVLDCSNPDPNKRPLACLQEQADIYFREQLMLLEDLDGGVAARVTPIGNLLIQGDVIEYSTATPDDRAFTVTRADVLGRTTVVAWIDRTTGDLHLTGALHEEQLDLKPTKGAFSVQNAQSINVLYFDKSTGDLYLRGNVIPYRKIEALRGETG